MPRWLPKLAIPLALVLLLTSGALQAARSWSPLGALAALPLPWTAQSRELQHRYAAVVPPPWSNTDDVIARMQARLRERPNDEPSYVVLAEGYLQKAREVGDPTYYGKAEAVLQQAERLNASDAAVLAAQGSLALSRHDFERARQLGERARSLDPYSANVLGIIGDADVQLGRDAEAVQVTQAMVDLRPDLSSYSRVSYLRELHGDLPGAIEAMQQAATAGGPTPENVAWTSWQLGTLYFDEGDLAAAQRAFERGLAIYPGYLHAEAGLGMLAAARGDYAGAIARYSAALNVMPWPQYIISLGDVYAAAGRPQDAEREYGLVDAIERLYRANGVNVDMELALFDADHHRDLPRALALAKQNLQQRPSVMAADALAWTQYQAGDCAGAATTERAALRLGTQLPLTLFHAGMIARCQGDGAAAKDDLTRTVALNPHFSVLYEGVAERTLRALSAAPTSAAAGRE